MSGPIGSGAQPDWERVLSAAARLQVLLPEAVLVGGTAAGLYARHRTSHDADHVLTDLRSPFDAVHASTVIFDHVCDLREREATHPGRGGDEGQD